MSMHYITNVISQMSFFSTWAEFQWHRGTMEKMNCALELTPVSSVVLRGNELIEAKHSSN